MIDALLDDVHAMLAEYREQRGLPPDFDLRNVPPKPEPSITELVCGVCDGFLCCDDDHSHVVNQAPLL